MLERRPRFPGLVRVTNARQHELARRFIGYGDKWFREGQYRQAYLQYREAEKAAPDLPDTYFREAFALIANRQYSMAYNALERGLSLDPQWPKRGFRLATLYGGRDLEILEHRAHLAQEIERRPNQPDLLFLLAVHLYCDDRITEAKEFFTQAQVSPPIVNLVSLFPLSDAPE